MGVCLKGTILGLSIKQITPTPKEDPLQLASKVVGYGPGLCTVLGWVEEVVVSVGGNTSCFVVVQLGPSHHIH